MSTNFKFLKNNNNINILKEKLHVFGIIPDIFRIN